MSARRLLLLRSLFLASITALLLTPTEATPTRRFAAALLPDPSRAAPTPAAAAAAASAASGAPGAWRQLGQRFVNVTFDRVGLTSNGFRFAPFSDVDHDVELRADGEFVLLCFVILHACASFFFLSYIVLFVVTQAPANGEDRLLATMPVMPLLWTRVAPLPPASTPQTASTMSWCGQMAWDTQFSGHGPVCLESIVSRCRRHRLQMLEHLLLLGMLLPLPPLLLLLLHLLRTAWRGTAAQMTGPSLPCCFCTRKRRAVQWRLVLSAPRATRRHASLRPRPSLLL